MTADEMLIALSNIEPTHVAAIFDYYENPATLQQVCLHQMNLMPFVSKVYADASTKLALHCMQVMKTCRVL